MENRRRTDHVSLKRGLIHATTFGPFSLIDQYGEIIPIKNRRAKTIVAMLCIAPYQPLERVLLSQLLWPGRFEAQAKASLRQCLLDITKIFKPISSQLITITRTNVSINNALLSSDISLIDSAFALKRYSYATELLCQIGTSDLLEQMIYGEQFAHWLGDHQLQFEQTLRLAMSQALKEFGGDTKLKGNEDDLVFRALEDATKIRHSKFNDAIASLNPKQRIRLAILPFKAISAGNDEHFADGIVDEIITMLGRLPELAIAGRNSSFGLKGSERSLPEIAKILGVEHLLEGSVQIQGQDIRINVGLINGNTGFEKWGKRYKGSINDIFALQERVAEDVTAQLSETFGIDLASPKSSPLTNNMQAYGLYVHGIALVKRRIGDGVMQQAVLLLEQALDLDPEFAEAWTALAEANAYLIFSAVNEIDTAVVRERIAFCAEKAMSLTAKQGHAMVLLGVYKWMTGDPVAALDLAFEAYRREPNNPDVSARLGSYLSYCGYTKQSLPYIVGAAEQEPLDVRHLLHLCTALLNIGDVEGAQKVAYKLTKLGMLSIWLGLSTFAAGDHALAVKQYQQSRLMSNALGATLNSKTEMSEAELDAYWDTTSKGVCSGQAHDRAKYCQLLEYMYATMDKKTGSQIAIPAVWIGYAPMVFKTIGQGITPSTFPALQSLWTDIEPIRQVRLHPDFMQFAENIGLTKVWDKYGLPDLLAE